MLKKRLFGITVLFAAFGIILAISLEGCGNEPLPLFSDHLDSDEPTQGLVYELIGMGYSVSRGEATAAQVVIPTSHEGLPVTAIANYGFSSYSNMTSIIIPDSVTSIGNGAFMSCAGLTSITIPNSVTSIGHTAFMGCTGLTSITIPNSVMSISENAFSGCTGLTSITIPNSVTNIGIYAFSQCTGLTSVTIPNSVMSIGGLAFLLCTGLTSIIIPNSVMSIGELAFYECTGLTKVFYGGANITDWNKINLSWGNSYLLSADRYYYSETNPGTPNSHWRWVGNVLTIWN